MKLEEILPEISESSEEELAAAWDAQLNRLIGEIENKEWD